MTPEKVIEQLTITGNVITLPPQQLDRDVYLAVKSKLEKIGGKWKGGKVQGFVFATDPTPEIERLRSGEIVNIKQEFQFFETPDALADRMVALARIESGDRILEPSAGQGAIVRAISRAHPSVTVDCFELMAANRLAIAQIAGACIVSEDFLAGAGERFGLYDRIIANPPWAGGLDCLHIRNMFDCLAHGGRIVTLASTAWRDGSRRKQIQFQEFIRLHATLVEELPRGTFKESGTGEGGMLLVIK